MEIDDLRNECMRETEEDINRRLLQNHEVVRAPVTKRLPEHTKRRPFQYQGFFISEFPGRRL